MSTPSDDVRSLTAPNVQISQHARIVRLLAANETNEDAFSPPADTIVAPTSGSGWAWHRTMNGMLHEFEFYGEGSDDNTGNITIVGASPIYVDGQWYWRYTPIWQGVVTLSTRLGLANSPIPAANRFADTIVTTTDYSLPTIGAKLSTQFADWSQKLYLDLTGIQMFGVHFDRVSAESLNGLVRAI